MKNKFTYKLQEGFELSSRKFRYQKFITPSKSSADIWRDPNHALDMVITGQVGAFQCGLLLLANWPQTLQEYDDSWGAFKFAGKVRRDGMIVLKREPVRIPLPISYACKLTSIYEEEWRRDWAGHVGF